MARTDAYSIFTDNGRTTEDKLKEVYGGLIDSIQKSALSVQLKNTNLSGDPKAGSVEVQRYQNSASKAYGTARGANAGTKLANTGKVTLNLDTRREIVEEITLHDVQQNTVDNLLNIRTANHQSTLTRELDYAFFTEAETKGNPLNVVGTTAAAKVEEAIQKVEKTKNDWVDGVDRSDIRVSLTPAVYGELRTNLDTVIGASGEEIQVYHGVPVFSNVRQSADIIAMAQGAVAQPVVVSQYSPDRIPLSNDMAIALFFQYTTRAVASDLIQVVGGSSS